MPSLSVHCCSWNVADEGPPDDDMLDFLGVTNTDIPDIIGIALQETVSDDLWRNHLIESLYPYGYVLIKSRNCWAIWMYVFVKRNLLVAIKNIESEATASGYAGVMGNKGGVSVRFEICGINVIFLSCHFAAHLKNNDERLNDYFDIIDHQSFRDEDVNVIVDHDYVFWMGDLNFRIDELTKSEIEDYVRENNFEKILPYDQLLSMKKENVIFQDFLEGQINFPPTFKFDKGTDTYDSSKKKRKPAWTDRILYMVHRDFAFDHHLNYTSRQRSPSPRRLPVRGSPSEVEKKYPLNDAIRDLPHPEATLLKYTCLSQYKYSDHKPVIADFLINVPSRWFCLPINFTEPISSKQYFISDNLEVSYQLYDPPKLIQFSQSKTILLSGQESPLCDFAKLLLINTIKTENANDNAEVQASNQLLPPPSLQTTGFDWIGLYPAEFADLENDYLTYVYANSSVSSDRTRKDMSVLSLLGSSNVEYSTKFDSKYLKKLAGQTLCLIYMSRNKRCPQGYSSTFKLQ